MAEDAEGREEKATMSPADAFRLRYVLAHAGWAKNFAEYMASPLIERFNWKPTPEDYVRQHREDIDKTVSIVEEKKRAKRMKQDQPSPDEKIGDAGYTRGELQEIIKKMEAVRVVFYAGAFEARCHPFIEFCGLMGEFIKICQNAIDAGVDFPMANTHTGKSLPMTEYNAAYLVEKLDCIFGPSIRADPEVKRIFETLITGEAGA